MMWSKYNIDFQLENNNIGVYNTFSNSFIELEKNIFYKIKNNLNDNKLF